MDKTAIFERVLVKELGPFRIEEFMRQADAGVQFASLKEISSSWRREDFVEEGGWAMVADEEYDNAAELCAERLMTMEAPVTQEAVSTDTGTVAQ